MKRCTESFDTGARVVQCDRWAGHEGQHESFPNDLAWGPPEPGWTGTAAERGEPIAAETRETEE